MDAMRIHPGEMVLEMTVEMEFQSACISDGTIERTSAMYVLCG